MTMRRAIWASNPVAFTVNDPRIQPVPFSGCWIWLGAVQDRHTPDHKARGTVLRNTVQMPAYRAFYEKRYGDVSELSLHHLCKTPLCCNPDHLEPMNRAMHAMHHFEESGAYRIAMSHKNKARCPKCDGEYTFDGMSRRCTPCRNASRKQAMRNVTPEQRAKRNAYKLAWKQSKKAERRAAQAVNGR